MSFVLKNGKANGRKANGLHGLGGLQSGNYVAVSPNTNDPGPHEGLGSVGGIVGSIIDIATSRTGSLLIAGTLTYLLIKSPAARRELGITAKGHYHKAKAHLGRKRGHGMRGIGPADA